MKHELEPIHFPQMYLRVTPVIYHSHKNIELVTFRLLPLPKFCGERCGKLSFRIFCGASSQRDIAVCRSRAEVKATVSRRARSKRLAYLLQLQGHCTRLLRCTRETVPA